MYNSTFCQREQIKQIEFLENLSAMYRAHKDYTKARSTDSEIDRLRRKYEREYNEYLII